MSAVVEPPAAGTSWRRRHPVAWASLLMGTSQGIEAVAMLAQVTLTARLLSRADFGLLGMAMGWAFLLSSLLDFRVWEVMTIMIPRFRSERRERRASALVAGCFLLEVAGGLVASSVLAASATWAARYYAKTPDAALLFLTFAPLPILMSAEEPARTLLKLAGQFQSLAWWRGLSALGQLAVVVAVLMFHRSPESVGAAIVVSWIARLLVLAGLTRVALSRLHLEPMAGAVRRLVLPTLRSQRALLASTMLSSIAARLNNRLDVVILGWLSLPEVVAPYDLARRLTSQVGLVTGPIEQVVFPRLSKMIATHDAERDRFLRKITVGLAALLVPGLGAGIIACPYVIPQVFGEKFTSAILPAQILLLAYLPTPLLWLRPLLAAKLENRFLVVAGYLSVIIQLLVGATLIPSHGLVAAALSVVAAQGFWWCALGWRSVQVSFHRLYE